MKTVRRIIVGTVAIALVLATVASAVPTQAATLEFPTVANLETGDLFKTESSSTVYYFGEDERRYGFPNEHTYFTWYADFSDVQTVTSDEMSLIPIGGMVTYRPHFNGDRDTRLLQIVGREHLYVSVGHGLLVGIKDETAAVQHFGSGWSQRVDVLPDAFVNHYTVTGTVIDKNATFSQLFDTYEIWEDKELESPEGVMIYTDPLRFATSDENVDCGQDYCFYNEVTVEQGNTIKFVNYADEVVTVREQENRWTTGPMEIGDIVVLTIDENEGEYTFYGNGDDDFVGTLIVE